MEGKRLGMIIVGIVALFCLVLIINTCNNCLSGCSCGGGESSACEHEYGEWLIEQSPTISEWGYVYKICVKCEGANKIPLEPFNNDYGRYTKTIIKEPTCTETGIAHFTFANLTFTVNLAMLIHTYSYTADNEDSTTDKFICSCGHFYNATHSYYNGHCNYCNVIQPLTVTYVDADGSETTLNHYYGDTFIPLERETTMQSYFHGWFDEKNNKCYNDLLLTKDLTVYAKWESIIQISSYSDFLRIYDAPDKVYRLTKNIDMGGRLLQPITNFSGIIDGYDDQNDSSFNIENFVITTDSTVTNHGLFAVNNGSIKNINFKSCTFSGSITWSSGAALGGIVGVNNGEIYNVSLNQTELNFNLTKREKTSNTYTFSIGLLVGKNTGRIEKATANGSAYVKIHCGFNTGLGDLTYNQHQYFYIGAMSGYNSGTITESNSNLTSTVTMELYHGSGDSMNGYIYYGSFVGYNAENGKISHSYAIASLNTSTPVYYDSSWEIPSAHYERAREHLRVGGFAGKNGGNGEISQCFASGNIGGYSSNSYYAGGFIGENADTANVKSCYCSTTVSSTAQAGGIQMGGFAGNNSAVIQNSYSTGNISTPVNATLGGFIANNALGGSITKSYTTSDINATSGSVGYFAGVNEGAIMSSYYTDDIILKPGSATQGKLSTTTYITEIAFNELIAKDFLKQNLYWDEEGWYIGSDNNPFLVWEFEKLHSYGEPTVITPDCENAGFTVYECVDCGLIFITDVIEPLGHNLIGELQKDKWIDATHTTEGKQYYYCSHNGEYGISAHSHEVTIEKLPHDDISEISCTQLTLSNGVYTYECSCGESLIVDNGNVTHSPKNVSYKEPLCGAYNEQTGEWEGAVNGNSTGRICAVCEHIIYGCEILAPHYYSEESISIIQQATCNQAGIVQKNCTLCDYSCEEELPMLTHTYKSNPLKCDLCGADRFIIDRSYTAINSLYDLQNVIPNGNYYLNCDLDLNNQPFTPLLSKEDPFVGIFIGNGYKIKNLTLSASSASEAYMGIFTAIGNGGYVVNLTVENLTISASSVNLLNAAAFAGYNEGVISDCIVAGTITVNLTANATRNTIGIASTSYDYNVGAIAANNGDNGLISSCKISAIINASYTVNTLLSPQSVSQYFKDLINNTALTNNVSLSIGGVAGVNSGKMVNCAITSSLNSELSLSNKVGGISRGKAFTYLTLNEGTLCGINSGVISDCDATTHNSFLHTKEQESIISNSAIQVLNVTLKQEYYKIIDNSVFENDLAGIIGKTTPSSNVSGLTITQ